MTVLLRQVGIDPFHMPSLSHVILCDPESLYPHMQVKTALSP